MWGRYADAANRGVNSVGNQAMRLRADTNGLPWR